MLIFNLISQTIPYLFVIFFFWLDSTAFLISHSQGLNTLLCFFILLTLNNSRIALLLFALFFLSLQDLLVYNLFGLSLPLLILIIPLGYRLSRAIEWQLFPAICLLTSTLFLQHLLIHYFLLDATLVSVFTKGHYFVNIIVLICIWSLKIAGRQGNRSYFDMRGKSGLLTKRYLGR